MKHKGNLKISCEEYCTLYVHLNSNIRPHCLCDNCSVCFYFYIFFFVHQCRARASCLRVYCELFRTQKQLLFLCASAAVVIEASLQIPNTILSS